MSRINVPRVVLGGILAAVIVNVWWKWSSPCSPETGSTARRATKYPDRSEMEGST
jgi:hypothetical protein